MKHMITHKEKAVLNERRRTIEWLSRPFIQRLIALLLSTLLAMSMGTTIMLALPQPEREIAMIPTTNQHASHPSLLNTEMRSINIQHDQDGITIKERRLS